MSSGVQWLVFLLMNRVNHCHFCKLDVFLDKLWSRLLNLVLVILFLIGFSNEKTLFLDIICFLGL